MQGQFIMVDEPTASVNQMAVATKKGASRRTCIGSTIPKPHIKAPTLSSSSPSDMSIGIEPWKKNLAC